MIIGPHLLKNTTYICFFKIGRIVCQTNISVLESQFDVHLLVYTYIDVEPIQVHVKICDVGIYFIYYDFVPDFLNLIAYFFYLNNYIY